MTTFHLSLLCSPGGRNEDFATYKADTGRLTGSSSASYEPALKATDPELPEPDDSEFSVQRGNSGTNAGMIAPSMDPATNISATEVKKRYTRWEDVSLPEKQRSIKPITWKPRNVKMNTATTSQEADLPYTASGSFIKFVLLSVVSYVRNVPQFATLNFLLLSNLCHAQQLVGFDTAGRFSGDRKIAMKTISLLSVDPCDRIRSQSYFPPVEKAVQLLYRPAETPLEIIQCRIAVTVQVLHCSSSIFRSDVYPADTLMDNQVIPVTDAQCRDMHKTGVFELKLYDQSITITGIKHSPQTLRKTLIGIKEPNGGCTGGQINIEGILQTSKVVTLKVSHQARQLEGKYSLNSGTVFVGDLVSFPFGVGFEQRCDSYRGCFTVAQPEVVPQNRCQQLEQLFTGQGQLFVPNVGPEKISQGYLEILQVSSATDSTMGTALTLTDSELVCGILVRKTNIPRLFVNFYEEGSLVSHELLDVSRPKGNPYVFLDILTSSSNVYLRGTLSVSEQFDKVSFRLCELRRMALNNVLRDLLTAGPSPLLNYRRGLLFVKKGSVAFIFVGLPVRARLRNTELCYNEIPVVLETETQGEVDAFLTSKARIIVSNGSTVACSQQSSMHFLRDFSDEMHLFNDTLREQFPDLAFSDEDDNTNAPGHWICQISGNFIACAAPSSLSPIIGANDHFYGIRGAFYSQSVLGSAGREVLYRTQVEGFNREVFFSNLGTNSGGTMPTNAGDLFVSHLSDSARNQLRQLVLPTFYLVFGSLLEYIEQFLLILFLLSFVMECIKTMTRLVVVFKYYGCSRYLLIAFFEGLYNAFIPWRSASRQKDRVIERLETEISELEGKLNNKVDRITDPAALTPTSPTNRPRLVYPSLPRRLDELGPMPKVSFPCHPDPNAPPIEPRDN